MTATTEEKNRVEMLKKITLVCKAGTSPGGNDLASGDESFDFIHGVATEGLTPFEFKLDGKTAGDIIEFSVPAEDLCKTFQHVSIPGLEAPRSNENVYFTVYIKDVTTPDNREVIKAMAELHPCEGGSCDCCGH